MSVRQGVPAPGYTMGVDLGTSNTVAIVRWPDGRTRPLLFDGAPVMPSGVYAHPSGQLVVGRDALRLAGGDPARFEPNPKRRIDEPTVLLGDREYHTVDLLAALLTAVARAAVEAVGFLPPAVVTYPAAWGPQRRAVLAGAVHRAGWPQPHFVPEPVAAARYFADVLRRPVPVGASLAVFDFGGGTLDVAVVRNEAAAAGNTGWQHGRPAFRVLGSGGVENLGGLDVDAALVEHLGGLIKSFAPDAWRPLVVPETVAQRRDRRLFWEDVRGAKEMLSRGTTAPVTVPGRDEALHLTREELERVAQPLLRRAVHETADVIRRCGLRPDQLAGLFLVGGSSRLPLVARMLHAELGIAPTVLEQPELPVAEGSLAEIAPGSPIPGSPVPASPVPASSVPVSPIPGGSMPASPAPSGPAQVARPWYRRRATWIAAGATAVVLALVATLGTWYLRRGTVDFANSLRSVDGAAVAFPPPAGGSSSYGDRFTATRGDRAYVAIAKDDEVEVGAIDLATGKPAWPLRTLGVRSERWFRIVALPKAVVVRADSTYSENGYVVVLDPENGHELWNKPVENGDTVEYFDSVLVIASQRQHRTWGYRWSDGDQRWLRPDPETKGASVETTTLAEVVSSELEQPSGFGWWAGAPATSNDSALIQITSDGAWRTLNPADGSVRQKRKAVAGGGSSSYLAYAGKLYVAGSASGASDLKMYDIAGDAEPTVLRTLAAGRNVDEMAPCGENRICLIEKSGSKAEVVSVDIKTRKSRTLSAVRGAEKLVPVGDQVLVVAGSGKDDKGGLVDPADGRQSLASDRRDDTGVRVGRDSLLLISGSMTSSLSVTTKLAFYGVGTAAPGDVKSLGERAEVVWRGCSWNTVYLVCPTDKRFEVWRFAK